MSYKLEKKKKVNLNFEKKFLKIFFLNKQRDVNKIICLRCKQKKIPTISAKF